MNKVGVLLHVYNLGSKDWERLVWGDPNRNELGVGGKLFEFFLAEDPGAKVHTIIYDGPSSKDGITEGNYTLEFLQKKQNEIRGFPKLRKLYDTASEEQRAVFKERVRDIRLGDSIVDTFDEIRQAAAYFARTDTQQIIHIAAATHAPRCIQLQAKVREDGFIPADQLWYTVASDRPFSGRSASDVVVVEPPHRADDPLLHHEPTLASLVRRQYGLTSEGKVKFIADVEKSLDKLYSDPKFVNRVPNSATK